MDYLPLAGLLFVVEMDLPLRLRIVDSAVQMKYLTSHERLDLTVADAVVSLAGESLMRASYFRRRVGTAMELYD